MTRVDMTGDVRVPALVLHGERDGCIGPACYRSITDRFAVGAEIEEISDVGHWLHIEQPDAIAERVIRFLRHH
jgi:pimeloyl-ACP methyl ester carboxylesterase